MRFHKINLKILAIFLLLGAVFACEEPYDLKLNLNKSVVIVDATLTDEADEQSIVIKESEPNGTSSSIFPMKGAQVEVIVDGKTKIPFAERATDEGNYLGPKGFKAELGHTYQLVITSSAGERFESLLEALVPGSAIKKAYQKLDESGSPDTYNYKLFHNVYIDTEDPVGKGNIYYWTYRIFESQEICYTCDPGARYFPNPAPGRCVKDLPNFLRFTVYDYQCNGACWEIIHSLTHNIMTDDFSDGKQITARKVAEVPVYQYNYGALIEIKQQSLSIGAYRYLKILIDQNQNSGGLSDTPPVALIGNIKSTKANSRPIAGYFRVTDESKLRYWVDRTDAAGSNFRPVGLLGRATNLEPQGMDTTRPPYAPCVPGYTRTNIMPEGWQTAK